MSYSLNTPCYSCKKNARNGGECIDQDILTGAVGTIHCLPKGHEGAGSVDLKCANYVDVKNTRQ